MVTRDSDLKLKKLFSIVLGVMLGLLAISFVAAPTALTGSFKDDFNDGVAFVNNWNVVGNPPSVPVNGSYVSMTAPSSIATKQTFHHGVLTMNVSLVNQTMTSALWGWSLMLGSMSTGAFFYYNGTTDKVYAVVGNLASAPTCNTGFDCINATAPQYSKNRYTEYSIVWSYSLSSTPYFIFSINGTPLPTLTPTGQLQAIDYFAFPANMTVKGTTSQAKLNSDYVVVSGTTQTVQTSTTTTGVTVTTTASTTLISSTTTSATSTSILATTTISGVSTSFTSTTTSVSTLTSASTTLTTATTTSTTYSSSFTTTSVSTSISETTSFSSITLLTTAFSTTVQSVSEAPWSEYLFATVLVAIAAIIIVVLLTRMMRGGKPPTPTIETGQVRVEEET